MMRIGPAIAMLVVATTHAAAQDGWDCDTDQCVALSPVQVLDIAGRFTPSAGVSIEGDADALAALEQQSWREVPLDVLSPARIDFVLTLEPQEAPDGWPADLEILNPADLTVLASPDGNIFVPIQSGDDVLAGHVVSVLVRQRTEEIGGKIRFYPAKWTLRVASRQVVDPALAPITDPGAPVLVPSQIGRGLGCATLGCGEAAGDAPDTTVAGISSPDAELVDAPVPATGGGRELAVELQTELARLGCYTSSIDGLWGPGSRAAMGRFNAATDNSFAPAQPTAKALVAAARQADPVCDQD